MRKLIALAAVLTLAFAGAASAQDVTVQENWTGTPRDDRHIGTPGRDLLLPGNGDDYVDARGGSDFVLGGHGDDVVIGGRGNDRIHGGPGNDRVFLGTREGGESTDEDGYSCGAGRDRLYYGEGDKPDADELNGCEVLIEN